MITPEYYGQIVGMVIVFIILPLFIISWCLWKVYEAIYYHRAKFVNLKEEMSETVVEFNNSAKRIEELRKTFTKLELLRYEPQKKIQKTYNCSLSVYRNAQKDPYKYICKYFNVEHDEQTLEKIRKISRDFHTADKEAIFLVNQIKVIQKNIETEVPVLIRLLSMEKLMKKLGFKRVIRSTTHYPLYTFRYVSP